MSLIKELGFEIKLPNDKVSEGSVKKSIELNGKHFEIPKLILDDNAKNNSNNDIKEALMFNKNIFIENFILPNQLRFPISRSMLEDYYN